MGAGQRVRGRDPGMARVLGASHGALQGSETCPGLPRAGGGRWTPASPRDLRVCARPTRIPAARRPLVVRSVGRGHSLAQVHSLPTCWPPTAHSGLALDRGCLLGGGRELPFAEVEVEYKSGDENAMIRYTRILAQKYGLTPEEKSKYRRALDLAGNAGG